MEVELRWRHGLKEELESFYAMLGPGFLGLIRG